MVTDLWGREERQSKVRYVPIQVEAGHPSTSTPNESPGKFSGRVRTVPVQLVKVSKNGGFTPARKPRMHTPVRPVVHAVIDDDDEPEVFNERLTFNINIEIVELAITTKNIFL